MAQQWHDFPTGTRVQVRNRFNQHWTSGFEVADVNEAAYRLRRLSDNAVLPVAFEEDEVRAEA
jgi:hypothetical protein